MSTKWNSQINLINKNESVEASTPNRPLNELYNRTQYLKERFDTALVGQALFAREQAVKSTVKVGTPVYFNSTTNQFEEALAAVSYEDGNYSGLANTALVVGMVHYKHTDELADIALMGFVEDWDLSAVLGSGYASGLYYLSGQSAGELTQTKPEAGLFVCQVVGTRVLVNPNVKEVLEDHIHHRHELDWRPCGEVTYAGGEATITAHDDSLLGWLPATEFSNAPAGAKFGYNLTADTQLRAIFPPIPMENALVQLDGVAVHSEACVVDQYGIWWMTDCEESLPWPNGYTRELSSSSSSSSSSSEETCPFAGARELILWFTRMTFKTDNTCVTGLLPKDDSPLRFYDADGNEASKGCLFADLEALLAQGDTDNESSLAVKSIDSDNKFHTGPVVVGLKGAGGLEVSGGTEIDGGYRSGKVIVTPTGTLTLSAGAAEVIALDNAVKSLYNGIPMIDLPQDRLSSIRCKAWLQEFTGDAEVTLKVWLLGKTAGNVPTISYSMRILTNPLSSGETSLPAISDPITGTLTAAETAWTGTTYMLAWSAGHAVTSRDLILFTIERDDSSGDGYNDDIGLLNVFFEVSAT